MREQVLHAPVQQQHYRAAALCRSFSSLSKDNVLAERWYKDGLPSLASQQAARARDKPYRTIHPAAVVQYCGCTLGQWDQARERPPAAARLPGPPRPTRLLALLSAFIAFQGFHSWHSNPRGKDKSNPLIRSGKSCEIHSGQSDGRRHPTTLTAR